MSVDVEGYFLQRYMQQHEEVELSALGMGMQLSLCLVEWKIQLHFLISNFLSCGVVNVSTYTWFKSEDFFLSAVFCHCIIF